MGRTQIAERGCPRCGAFGSMGRMHASGLWQRGIRKFTSFRRYRCRYCSSEAWFWKGEEHQRSAEHRYPAWLIALLVGAGILVARIIAGA